MNAAACPDHPAAVAPVPPWHAELRLRFARQQAQTRAIERIHRGPLRVQRMLYPQGPDCCHALLLHPPGGIAGGDQLRIEVALDAQAHALLTTPGAGKWYRSVYAEARQRVALRLENDACLEWLPQETLLFDGARARQEMQVRLNGSARWLGWDIVQLGRLAAGESWSQGHWAQRMQIFRGPQEIWREQADFEADAGIRRSPLGLAGHPVFATLWIAGPRLTAEPESALDAVRAVPAGPATLAAASWLQAPAELLVVRVLGQDCSEVRSLCERMWHTMRPWICDLPAQRPRIWNT
ncbi:urease accessory protein UreD [Frateuria aurantia]